MFERRVLPSLAIAVALVLPAASCAPTPNLREVLEITDVTTGYFDAGFVGGVNKIVPSISFRVQKREDVRLDRVSLNVIFRTPDEAEKVEEEWDVVFVQGARFEDGQTQLLVVRSERGYTGEQARAEMFQHSQFRDVRARIFARYGSGQWVELAVFPIERQILTR